MRAISDQPESQLFHIVRKRHIGSTVVTTYAASPIRLSRPEPGSAPRGWIRCTVPCTRCGADVELKVYDRSTTRARRVRWLVFGAVCGFVLLGGAVTLVVTLIAPPSTDAVPTYTTILTSLAILGAILFLTLWSGEDGVVVPARSQRRDPHHLASRRPPGRRLSKGLRRYLDRRS